MGCGMSRYGMADHLGFDPIRRKLLNLHKDDPLIAVVDDTPSTKLLLKDAEEPAVSNADNSRKSISNSPHEKALKDPSLEHKESLKVAKGDGKKKKNGEEGGENEVKAKNEEVVAAERDGDKDDNNGGGGGGGESDDEGRVSDYDGSALSWIDSPSFREYCTHESDSDDGFKDGGDGSSDGEKKEIKVEGDKCKSSANSNEACVWQGAATKTKRKGSKGRKSFRTVFPKGKKPSAMKNLLHVTSCYNPNSASAARDQKVGKQNEKTV